MPKHHILIEKEFNTPLEEVFNRVCDHEEFGRLIGSNIARTKDGKEGNLNGLGSIRTISIGPLPTFEETVTAFKENEYFEYKITKGSPIKNHIGKLRFSSSDNKTQLSYSIDFDMRIPLPLLGSTIAKTLKSQISKGLDKIN